MALSDELGALNKAFTGLGVDEKTLITILGKWDHEKKKTFRKGSSNFFLEDERQFEKWVDQHIADLNRQFLRFKSAMVLWTMHPWERDARLVKDALTDGPNSNNVIIEIACTRSSEELLGARKAYHSLFDRSIEEDVAASILGPERKLLVALVSAYRYEGSKVNEKTAKSEAKTFHDALKNAGKKNPLEDEDVVRILSTRSKLHLKTVFEHYKEVSSKHIFEDLGKELALTETVQCLITPPTYFSKVLMAAMEEDADENTREGLTRVVVTRADEDMESIEEEYHHTYGISLSQKIEATANGNYREFLLTLIARGE